MTRSTTMSLALALLSGHGLGFGAPENCFSPTIGEGVSQDRQGW